MKFHFAPNGVWPNGINRDNTWSEFRWSCNYIDMKYFNRLAAFLEGQGYTDQRLHKKLPSEP